MNKKIFLIMICLLFIIFTTISTVSSEEIVDDVNETVSHTHTSLSDVISEEGNDQTNHADISDGIKRDVAPGTFTELNALIQSASEGDTIVLDRDYAYYDSDIDYILGIQIHTNQLTINGNGHTINGSDKARIFAVGTLNNAHSPVENVNLYYINFVNARNTEINNTNPAYPGTKAKDSAFGAVEFYASGQIAYCNFFNNYAFCAGALAIMGYGDGLTIWGCNFTNNTGFGQGGGAIRLRTHVENLWVMNSWFENNYGGTYGGAIHSDSGVGNQHCTIYNCDFVNNRALNGAGGVFFETPNGTVRDSRFVNNSAPYGGGVYWNGYSGTVYNSNFTANNATTGGGIYCSGRSTTSITTSRFENNSAENGGGVYFDNSVGSSLYYCSFNNNTVSNDGGAVYCKGQFFRIEYSNFTKDSAANNGGSLYLDVGAYVNNCSFHQEHADVDGGSIYFYSKEGSVIPPGVDLGVFSSTFTNCSAGHDGGAGYVYSEYGTVKNTIFANCSAGHDGGAGYVYGGYGRLIDSELSGNLAYNDGGALYWAGDNGTMTNTTYNSNTALGDGGALHWSGNNGNLSNTNFTYNYALGYFENNKGNGGSISWLGSNGTVTNCNFAYSASKNFGGVIDVIGNNTHITESSFQRYEAKYGGALSVEGNNANITNTVFNYGNSNMDGAAILIVGNNTYIANSNLSYHHALRNGGSIYIEGDNTIITDSNLEYSYAEDSAGAIYVEGGHTLITNSNFTHNNASAASGGSVYISGSDTNITYSSFQYGTAKDGGAIYVEGSNTNILKSNFSYNGANPELLVNDTNGGSIYVAGDNTLISESNFIKTNAGDGGAIYVEGDNTNITNSNFGYLFATNDGGAIYIGGLNSLISNSTFQFANATRGGGVYVAGNNTNITESLFQFLTCKEGGAIYVNGSDTNILKSNFLRNGVNLVFDVGETKGGSIFIEGHDTLVSESNFTYMSAGDGGAIYITGDKTNITDSKFQFATVSNNGGLVYVGGMNTTISDSTFSFSNATNGGAIYVNGTDTNINANISYCFAKGGNGGGIYIEGDNNNITGTNFTVTNTIGGNGGAIYAGGDNLTISNCYSNISVAVRTGPGNIGNGGAVYISGEGVTITESRFERYNATDNGGGLYVEGNDVDILNSSFEYGEAKLGGGIYINGNNTYVENSNLTHNHANVDGGVIYINGNNATITDTNLQYSYAARSGGAVFINGANNTITKSNLTYNNASTGYGGSIYINGEKNNISLSSFEFSTSTKGGAIYINGSDANVGSSYFSQNGVNPAIGTSEDTAGGSIYIAGANATISEDYFRRSNAKNGAIIYIEGDNATISNSNLTESIATYNGGAIYIAGHDALINNSAFRFNNATTGGAIFVNGTNATITDSNFTRTIAVGGDGGAVYIGGDDVNIIDSNFNSTRTINGNGGSIYIGGDKANVSGSTFDLGVAVRTGSSGNTGNGGMIYIAGENATIESSNFTRSNASVSGGALYIQGNNSNIINSDFGYSEARYGGSIYINGTNTHLDDSTLRYSHSTQDGGVIYVNGNDALISNSSLDFSYAGGSGGTIYISGANATIVNSNLTHNNATRNGGSVYIEGDNTNITESLFQFGIAQNGGAIYINGTNATISQSTFLMNNVTTSWGQGGSVYVAGNDAHIDSSTFERSNAYQGGIVYINGNNTNISFSNFTKSYSYGEGGALYVNGVNASIGNSKFSLHNATYGGAVYINGENTEILNSEINESYASGFAGGIFLGGTNTKIYNSTFDDNYARQGGAIYNNGGTALVLYSNFTNNIANSSSLAKGGAIFWKGGSTNDLVLECNFDNNSVISINGDAYGGAIYWEHGDVPSTLSYIINTTFVNNTSERHGGAIDWYNADNGVIENCTFIENYATADGGALYTGDDNSNGENLTIRNSNFVNNSAGDHGGALSMQFYNSLIKDCNFTSNYARYAGSVYMQNKKANQTQYINCIFLDSYTTTYSGGAAIIYVPYVDFINCTFENCTTPGREGGAILFGAGADFSRIIDSNFTNCYNASLGGAISIIANNINITGSNFNHNNATQRGGSIYVGRGTNTTIDYSTFNNNTAYQGGAIFVSSRYNNITNSRFDENNAIYGGAIYVDGIYNSIINSTFNKNNATYGGSIHVVGTGHILDKLTVDNSTAVNGGGIFVADSDGLIISNSSIFGNLATLGAGIYYSLGYDNMVYNTRITNNNATKGSGIYVYYSDLSLEDVILLDNQAHAVEFVNESIVMGKDGKYYLVATFIGNDNLLNAIWNDNSNMVEFTNVTYWGVNGINVTNEVPSPSTSEVWQNITIERYDSSGTLIGTDVAITNGSGTINYEFADDGDTKATFKVLHLTDNYYTETSKDVSIKTTRVTIAIADINFGEDATVNVTLHDAEGNPLTGTVRVVINDSTQNFTINVINGEASVPGVSGIPAGIHNATVTFEGNTEYLGSTNSTTFIVRTSVDLSINKTVDKTNVNVSDIVEFTITVTNHGPSNATGVNVTDILDERLEYINSTASQGTYDKTTHLWTIGNITNGLTVTLTIRAKVLTNGTIPNFANVTSFENDTNTSNNNDSSDNITANPKVNLTIIKTANITNATVGDIVNYTITITNHGPSNATNVEIRDVLDNGLIFKDSNLTSTEPTTNTRVWVIGDLENGSSATIWFTAEIINNGTITNVALVNSTEDPTGNTSNETNITVTPKVNLTVIKTTNVTNASVGDFVNYTITVINHGPSNATNVEITDTLDNAFQFNETNGTYTRDNQIIKWTIPLIVNGTNATVWVSVKVLTNGTFTNFAVANSTEDPTGNKSNATNITVNPKVNLTVIKTANITGNVSVGDIVNYTITIINYGPSNATNVEIKDVLNETFKYKDASENSTYTEADNTIIWTIPLLVNSTNTTVWVSVEVTSNGTFSNFATANSTEDPTGNKSNATNITVNPKVNLTVIKTANVTTATVGDTATFTITVINNGPSNATNVEITDTLDEAFEYISSNITPTGPVGRTYTWKINNIENGTNATLTITVKLVKNGTFSNIAVANSTEDPTGNTSNTTNITVNPFVNLTVIKTANATNVSVGDVVNFTITIYNNGLSEATGVQIIDVLNPAFSFIGVSTTTTESFVLFNRTRAVWNVYSLPNGTNKTVWIAVRLVTNGTFGNFATVNSTEDPTGNTSNTTNITANPFVNLSITKGLDIASVSVGDIVNYTLTIYNTGLSNATNVEVTDELAEGLRFVESNIAPNRTDDRKYIWVLPVVENGTSVTIWLTVNVTVNGTFTNFATVNSSENTTPNESNEVNITVGPKVTLDVIKVSNVTGNVSVGDTVKFTITVINTGLSNATNVEIYDTLNPAFQWVEDSGATRDGQNIKWVVGHLENGTNHTVWVTVRVLTNGTFLNVALVNSSEIPGGNTSNTTNITAIPKVNLTISKTVDKANVTVGDTVRFTITVINYGPSNATNIEITDVLNETFEFVRSYNDVSPDTNSKITWLISSINVNRSAVVWVEVKVLNNGTFSNVAVTNCRENTTNLTSNETNVTVIPDVKLTLIKTVNVTNASVNDIVNFTITVYNTGLSNATNVNVTDLLPDGLVYVDSGSNITGVIGVNDTLANGTKVVNWTIPKLNNGTSVSLWVTVIVTTNGTFTNVAFTYADENTTNKTNETNITVIPVVDLVINKTVNKTLVNVSDIVEFTITVTNRGPSNATGVNVTDVLDSHLKYIGSTPSQGNYNPDTHIWTIDNITSGLSVNLSIRAEVISNGTIPNFAFVTSNENDTNTSNNNDSSNNITATPKVNLTIIKTANVTGNITVGDSVNYTITITNYGPSNATGVEIVDNLVDGLEFITANGTYTNNTQKITWNIGDLNNGTNATVWVTVKVINNGTFINVATVNSTEDPTGNTSNETNITVTPNVNLTVIKTANVTGSATVGDIVNFTITVINTGLSNATNVEIRDVLNDTFKFVDANGTHTVDGQIVNWTIPVVGNGSNVSVWVSVNVTANGTFSNVAVVNSTENPTGNTSNGTNITVTPNVNLTVIKTANVTGNVTVGDIVNFTITVINTGLSNATNVEITDVLNNAFEYVNANGTPNRTDQTIKWTIPLLANGTNASVWVTVKVINNGTYSNVAFANSTEDPKGNTSNQTNITATPNVNLTVIKVANVSNVKVDDLVNFTITVYNNGLSNATNVNITDVLPVELVYVSSGGIVTGTPGELPTGTKIVKWTIPLLANGTNASVWVTVNVTAIGTFTNVAFANSDENDTNKTNETNISAKPAVDLVINKTVNATRVNVSDTVEFTITVTNLGPSNATDVNVTDVLDSRLQYIDSTASQGKYNETTHLWTIGNITHGLTLNLTIRAKVISNGTIPNFAFVKSNETDTNTSNNNDSSDNITANPVVNLTVVKVSNVTGNVSVGDTVQFTITVTNLGPSNATNVQITDELNPHFGFVSANASGVNNSNTVTWNIGNLANGSSASVNVIVKVLGNGTFSNVAVANSTENPEGNKSNETNVTVTPNVNLTIIKTANVTGNVTVGDLVNFTITISNNGLSNATNVEITDKLDKAFELVSATEDKTLDADGKLVWTISKLNNGSSYSVWVTVRVVTNGTFSNVAVVNSSENPDGTKSNETNVTVTPNVNLTITKTSNVTEGQNVSVGDLIKFTITVKNNGPSNATDVKVTDVLSEAFDYDSGTTPYSVDGRTYVWKFDKLEVGEEKTIEVIVKAKLNGFYSNVAIVNSSESENKTSNETPVIILPAVNLSVIKTANVTRAALNDTVNFTIVVTNNGPSTAHNVTLIDLLPSGMEYLESGSNITGLTGTPSTTGGRTNVKWVIDELPNGAKALVWVTVKALESGTFTNVVTANSSENKTGTTNETEVNVSSLVDLSITKTVSKTSVYVGDKIVYTITVKNIGTVDATGVIVNENLKGTVRLVNAVASKGNYNSASKVWNISDLASGDVATLSLTFEVLKVETIENSVIVKANENDTNTTNNNDTSEKVKVNTLPTPIKLETHDINYTEEETLTVTLPKAATGYVDITVANETYTNQPIKDGVVTLIIPDLAGGDYNVTVKYAGDGTYSQASTKGNFTVFPLTPTVNIEAVDIFYGEIEVLNVTVNAPGTVNITVNGKTISYIPLNNSITSTDALEDQQILQTTKNKLTKTLMVALTYNGKTTWNLINLPVGTYPVFAIYNGNENYTTANATGEFEVKPLPSWVNAKADDIYVGEDAIINLTVTPNATGNITVNIEDKNYTVNINNGKAQLIIPGLKAGEKEVTVFYNGDEIYSTSENTTNFTVKKIQPPITIESQDIYEGENETITIRLPTDATGNVTIKVNGQTYTKELINGEAQFTIPDLNKGTYDIEATYDGDDKYLPTNGTDTFHVLIKPHHKPIKPKQETHNIGLSQYPTGNPLLVLLIALLTIGIGTQIKTKK